MTTPRLKSAGSLPGTTGTSLPGRRQSVTELHFDRPVVRESRNADGIPNQFTPDYASPPGDTLLELLESQGMSQAELSRLMNRPKKTINEIVKGKASITPLTALQLEGVFPAVPARFWLLLEADYRLALIRAKRQGVKE